MAIASSARRVGRPARGPPGRTAARARYSSSEVSIVKYFGLHRRHAEPVPVRRVLGVGYRSGTCQWLHITTRSSARAASRSSSSVVALLIASISVVDRRALDAAEVVVAFLVGRLAAVQRRQVGGRRQREVAFDDGDHVEVVLLEPPPVQREVDDALLQRDAELLEVGCQSVIARPRAATGTRTRTPRPWRCAACRRRRASSPPARAARAPSAGSRAALGSPSVRGATNAGPNTRGGSSAAERLQQLQLARRRQALRRRTRELLNRLLARLNLP